ncbi:hypothetical protein QH639_20830 [Lysinibacillus sp. 1 U-2021]|uniref:hypothetical protein n=1 Tax=Lysinibacillus sp. 1 U-2021 TaxID=3039426 RepID=UPI0024806B54|nr:hypothetical protein [Lysinibacillus sp. 1 U-2021]WGT38233.1 hypothetical protein QH639_20830 [Lysinibacillus sp. 1 U-2021]
MALEILRSYEQNGLFITEYTPNGVDVTHIERRPTIVPPTGSNVSPPTVEEMQAQTLINTEYLIAMNEMGIQGGNV